MSLLYIIKNVTEAQWRELPVSVTIAENFRLLIKCQQWCVYSTTKFWFSDGAKQPSSLKICLSAFREAPQRTSWQAAWRPILLQLQPKANKNGLQHVVKAAQATVGDRRPSLLAVRVRLSTPPIRPAVWITIDWSTAADCCAGITAACAVFTCILF